MSKEKVIEKLNSLFKEEQWGRIEPKDIGISKFKILDDIFNMIVSENIISESLEICNKHLDEYPESITAVYLIGLAGYHNDSIEDQRELKHLIEVFTSFHKWAVVERISEKILEFGENSFALRSLAMSLEKLGRSKDAIPILENLLKIDRFDANVAKKLSLALASENREKSIYYNKLAIEGFIKIREFDEVVILWNKLVEAASTEDIPFFERIERSIVDAKEFSLVALLLKSLLNKYKDEENPDQSIEFLKKILSYKPDDHQARRDLIKFYEIKYSEHSQFDQFLKLSKLSNFKTPVKFAIEDFEKNIVFDKGNYVFHGSWKLGKIVEIDNERLTIDFEDKSDHQMSIKMGLQSLTPISNDHIYVMKSEDPEMLKSLFKDDFLQFFEILIKSYGGKILLADIKRELISEYVEEKNWGKWWTKARTLIKKDSNFGVSEKKKDLFFMRDKPLTYVEELLDNFTRVDSFSSRLDVAIEFINNIEKNEGSSVVQYFIDYFTGEIKGQSFTRQILSFFILRDLAEYVDPKKIKLDPIRTKVLDTIRDSRELHLISMKISSYDYKKDLVNLIEESREDWSEVVSELLFESPVRIHKYIMNKLIRAHSYNIINNFIDRVTTGAKQYPEVFIWVAKNLFTKTWDYEWLDYSRERLVITFFRLMNELKKIESEGNRLKNMTVELIFGNEEIVLKEIVKNFNMSFVGKLYDLSLDISYLEDSQRDKFLSFIKERSPEFTLQEGAREDAWDLGIEKIIVTKTGLEKKKAEFDQMVNVQMVNLSKELAKVSEASADQRENVEYNALLEKQSILKLSISRLDEEMKTVTVLDENSISTDSVVIGTGVFFTDLETGEKKTYTILGPWDADFEKNILSFRSPIARSMLGKKVDEIFELNIDDTVKKYRIESILPYTETIG